MGKLLRNVWHGSEQGICSRAGRYVERSKLRATLSRMRETWKVKVPFVVGVER